MQLLSQIKKDMDFNLNLYNLIEILKQIAFAQYHMLEKKIHVFEDFMGIIGEIFSMIDINMEKSSHPLLNMGKRQPAVIAVTSDSGLLGGLNMQVMNLAIKLVKERGAKLIIIGEKGKTYAQESDIPYTSFEGIKDETRYAQALAMRDFVINEELNCKIGLLLLIYAHPLSIISQKVQSIQLLPFSKSHYSQLADTNVQAPASLILESSAEDIIEYLVYLLLGHKFNEIFGLSRLAELSARFVHLEDSKSRIEQLNKQLKLQYFRQRHELIDRNMRELFAARLAFK